VPASVLPLVAAVNNLRTDLTTIDTDRRDANAEKDRLAALPQTFAKRFGTPVCEEVMRFCEVDSMDDLPPLLKTIGSHTKQANDLVAIRSSVDRRASDNNCVANQWSKPEVNTWTQAIFREHHITATGDTWGQGFTPFAVTCSGHPDAKDAASKANRLNLVETGNTGITYANTVVLDKVDARLPTDHHQCAEKLQGHSVLIDLYLGTEHRFAVAYREHLVDLAPFMILGLRHVYRAEGNFLLMICLRIMYWHQQELFYFLDLLQKGDVDPPLPEFAKLLKALRIKNHDAFLPTLPETWVQVQKRAKPSGIDSSAGGTGKPLKKKAKTITNPDVDTGLQARYKASGHKNVNQCLKVGQDAGVALILPKIGGKEACLNYLWNGVCREDCKRAETHKHAGPTVIQKGHDLLDQCGVAKSE